MSDFECPRCGLDQAQPMGQQPHNPGNIHLGLCTQCMNVLILREDKPPEEVPEHRVDSLLAVLPEQVRAQFLDIAEMASESEYHQKWVLKEGEALSDRLTEMLGKGAATCGMVRLNVVTALFAAELQKVGPEAGLPVLTEVCSTLGINFRVTTRPPTTPAGDVN